MLLMQEQNKSHFVDVEFLERFQPAVDPHPPPLRMVPFSGNPVHVFHTIWPSCLLARPCIFCGAIFYYGAVYHNKSSFSKYLP